LASMYRPPLSGRCPSGNCTMIPMPLSADTDMAFCPSGQSVTFIKDGHS
jgi:hypothetical protein